MLSLLAKHSVTVSQKWLVRFLFYQPNYYFLRHLASYQLFVVIDVYCKSCCKSAGKPELEKTCPKIVFNGHVWMYVYAERLSEPYILWISKTYTVCLMSMFWICVCVWVGASGRARCPFVVSRVSNIVHVTCLAAWLPDSFGDSNWLDLCCLSSA